MERTHTMQHQKQTNKQNPIKRWAQDPNRQFSKGDIKVVNTYMNRCSTLLVTVKCKTKPQ